MLLWLLERGWAGSRDGGGVEARRALANLLRDPGVAPDVLGLPGAVPWLVLMLTGDAEEGGDTSGLSNAVLEATARIHVLDDPSSKDVEFTVAALKGSGRGGGGRGLLPGPWPAGRAARKRGGKRLSTWARSGC